MPSVEEFEAGTDAAGCDYDDAGKRHEGVEATGEFVEMFFDFEVFVFFGFPRELDGEADVVGVVVAVAGIVASVCGFHHAWAATGDNVKIVIGDHFCQLVDIFILLVG